MSNARSLALPIARLTSKVLASAGLCIGMALSASAQALDTTAPVAPPPTDVALCEVMSHPSNLNNVRIRVTGFVDFGFENFRLWDPKCPKQPSGFEIWVTYGGRLASGTMYCCPGEANPRTSPEPYPLVEDDSLEAFRSLLFRERDTVVRATLVGTLLAHREGTSPIERMSSGYGHMGCCSLLIVERVESFEPHTRNDVDYTASSGHDAFERLLDRCTDSGVDHSLRDASGEIFFGPSFNGGDALIQQQAAADGGARSWALTDPARVAWESLREVRDVRIAASAIRRVQASQGRQVYELRQDGLTTMILVVRPYWLSFYARTSQVAWVTMRRATVFCER